MRYVSGIAFRRSLVARGGTPRLVLLRPAGFASLGYLLVKREAEDIELSQPPSSQRRSRMLLAREESCKAEWTKATELHMRYISGIWLRRSLVVRGGALRFVRLHLWCPPLRLAG